MSDHELFSLIQAYSLGHYMSVLSEGSSYMTSESNGNDDDQDSGRKKKLLLLRSLLALGQLDGPTSFNLFPSNMTNNPSMESIQYLSQYYNARLDSDLSAMEQAKSRMKNLVDMVMSSYDDNPNVDHLYNLAVSAVTLYIFEGMIHEAHALLQFAIQSQPSFSASSASLEDQWMIIHLHGLLGLLYFYLKRVDLASSMVMTMKKLSDDAIPTMMTNILVQLLQTNGNEPGTSRVQEAVYLIHELMDAHGRSSLLLNMLASSQVLLGKYEEANMLLVEACQANDKDYDSLAQLIVVLSILDRTADSDSYMKMLNKVYPRSPLLYDLQVKENLFDRCATKYLPA